MPSPPSCNFKLGVAVKCGGRDAIPYAEERFGFGGSGRDFVACHSCELATETLREQLLDSGKLNFFQDMYIKSSSFNLSDSFICVASNLREKQGSLKALIRGNFVIVRVVIVADCKVVTADVCMQSAREWQTSDLASK